MISLIVAIPKKLIVLQINTMK